ncbi:hypothetical protein EUGRSUZ_F00430 [Eucalyptus grandis]|uniref:Uncharacterized protein n=1 Tax=Eucalyptus grandis TaxID=71139 RepID=A0ACC3KAW7_EUCGR|nr:hypothetical protein EUGRSUZ_F00430 [Eucalyptus grandis]
MNIVKGVADLIRRTSSGQTGDSSSGLQGERFPPPAPKIRFSEVGDEAILYTLWERYEKEVDKVEKKKLFQVFLKQFLTVYENWEPVNYGQFSEASVSSEPLGEYSSHVDDIVSGCSIGHPAGVISIFIQEIAQLTTLINELSSSIMQSNINLVGPSTSFIVTSEGIPVLVALSIVTRSMHNCRVFDYYGGVQKLTALMKGAVVQLKTITGSLSADENFSNFTLEKIKLLQQILVHVVSIIYSFIDWIPHSYKKAQFDSSISCCNLPRKSPSVFDSDSVMNIPMSETRSLWHQKAVVSLMEAGGLNWLVDLLRVIRRLSMKEQFMDVNLQHLTLKSLLSALSGNLRGQNHFKSIGGLEVLLDGLGLPTNNVYNLKNIFNVIEKRDENPLLHLLRLHILSLEVLREAVFGNLSNLQFLCENGRTHKFANSFCSPAFFFQEHKQQDKVLPHQDNLESDKQSTTNPASPITLPSDGFSSHLWVDYIVKLSIVLCSFLYAPEDVSSHHVQGALNRAAMPGYPAYGELSVKWVLKVLLTVFPCIRVFSDQTELPSHLRIFINTLQHFTLNAFRKVLVSLPASIEVFRDEGLWELFFSENFFYFGSAFHESCTEICKSHEGSSAMCEVSSSNFTVNQLKASHTEILQMEIISFVELAATSRESVHNLPELSVLLDALEQCAYNSRLSSALARSLLHILQLSAEKTLASFKALDAIPRILKVVCIQAQELRRSRKTGPSLGSKETVVPAHRAQESDSSDTAQNWQKSMETAMNIFSEYLSSDDEAKLSILVGSTSVDCLFDLFWEEDLRRCVLNHILDLMKIVPSSAEDQKATLYLCSKYLETFTQIKEHGKSFVELSIDLLVGIREMVQSNLEYYQALFREGQCFLHVVSLLNGNLDMVKGEELVLNVLQTLTCLLAGNDVSKIAFRALVGSGYQTLQSLLLDFCQWQPGEALLNALLDMLVDGRFDVKSNYIIKNEDVIILYLSVLQKSSASLRHHGLNTFQLLLRDSISNRASCIRVGTLSFLLDWFSQEDDDHVIMRTAQLIQVMGGHSISGKDIRKIFALLRSEKVGARQQYCSLLLTTVLSMLNERGPTAFFDLSGSDSGIQIRSPIQWPLNKGFSFSCWLRVENFPRNGAMSLFSFLTENGRGCVALLSKDRLIYESVNLKEQSVGLQVNLVRKKWHHLCLTHSIGRAFSGGSLLRCYLDGDLVSSDRCRYPKVNEQLTHCTIGAKVSLSINEEDGVIESRSSFAFHGQIGPVYLFNDAITPELVQGVYSLGPSYMYSFLDHEIAPFSNNQLPSGILDAKDGLASKVVFGLNAQASDGKRLFNASAVLDHALDRNLFEANVMVGTHLCSRRLLQQIIYCVGGVSVFFPLIAQSERYEHEESGEFENALLVPITKDRLTAEIIELIACVLDENLANQQQMHILSGFSILGFLLRSVPPQQLNLETLSALKHLFNVIANCSLGEVLVKDAIAGVFLDPLIWVYTAYRVQRELYMQSITAADVKALVSFFESSQDMACIEDVLHMVIRAISQKPLLASFLDQVNMIGGCHIFVNLLNRDFEPIRLLGLQFIGRLLVGIPSEKKGTRFFGLGVGRSRSLSESYRNISTRMQPIFSAISDRLFKFPQTDNLCATLFDVLLGGASPKQVLQKHYQIEKQRTKGNGSHFFLPQVLVLIFKFLSGCNDASVRMKILRDLTDLLDSNPSNIEALMEHGWPAWLTASVKLDFMKNYGVESLGDGEGERSEQSLVRNLFCVVLAHHIHSVKGGWQQLEDTVNFLLMHSEQDGMPCHKLLHDIFHDLVQKLVDLSSEENMFVFQPCRDNTLYLLKLVDEMLISELDNKLPFPASSSDFTLVSLDLDSHKEFSNALQEVLRGASNESPSRNPQFGKQPSAKEDNIEGDRWWNLYDNLWILISEINGKGPSRMLPKSSSSVGPSFGQRARGLVESLNIPAAEMAAVVVSGGIGNALGGKPSKSVDRAMLLRGEKGPRIVFRLVILYLCSSSLERASRCVQLFVSLLPCLMVSDDEQSKMRLQLFIWALLSVRSRYGMLDDGARFHVISHVIRETVNCGKSMLATSIAGRDDPSDSGSISKERSTIQNLIQKDRVLAAVADEAKYMKALKTDRSRQLNELCSRLEEISSAELSSSRTFEDEIQSSFNNIIASDDNRKAAFQLCYEEQQQNVAEKSMHLFRILIDERGPWSANAFPNSAVRHWKLDKTEDRWRRRQKLRQNYHFDEKLCYPPSIAPQDETTPPVNESKYGFAGHIPEQMKRFLLKGVRKITDEASAEPNENEDEVCVQKISAPEDSPEAQHDVIVKDGNDHKDFSQDRVDSSASSPEAEISDEVLISAPCVLVTPKRKIAGRLAVMKTALHFFGEYLVEGTGGSSAFKDFQQPSNSDLSKLDQKQRFSKWPPHIYMESDKGISFNGLELLSENVHQRDLKNLKRHRRWSIGKIKAVHWTRYLLRYTATEIFFSDSSAPIFLNFTSQKDAKEIGTLIVTTRNEFLFPKGSSKDKHGVISFVDRRVALEMAEAAREKWRKREINNFEYLTILNTLSGRSYNDITQYPVFPWVLADYSSEVLDFNKSSTFRDLTKPVGALDSKRFEVFEDRYSNFCDPDIPSFYYGSHYSSMGIVLYYLLRLEPFTTLHRNLQGGKFDHADRLFQSVEGTYRNCLSNTSDVKELVPEFFYMSEFLVNSNSYHLGVKQDGEPIGDVCLPPWAKGSPEEFVNKNREALESEYVSSNLHHWIDLVFGFKQRGKPAVEAANIFYYLTYEGAVDLDSMEDDLQRAAIEDQIANFGQTPIQIFRKKHPRRGPPIPIAHPLYFAPSSINLTSVLSSIIDPPSAVLYVGQLDSTVVLVNQGLILSVKMWLTTQLQSGGNFTFSGSQEPFFGVGADFLSPRKIGSPLSETCEFGAQCFATLQTPTENFLISCGNWENSFQLISLTDGRLVQNIRHHKDVVSCVAVASDGSVLATGSYDTTVMVWEVYRVKTPERRLRNLQAEIHRKDYVVVETPFHILCGHDDIITCLYISMELDIVISGSKDGTCIFHTLREGRYVRSLCHPSGSALSKLVASRHGRIVLYADDDLSLHLYSINGKHLASSESNGRLNSVELSSCGEFLVCSGDQGQIVVRSMNTLEVVQRYNGVGKIITSLVVTPEECFLAGTKDGSLLVYSIDNPQHRKSSHPRNVKSKSASMG